MSFSCTRSASRRETVTRTKYLDKRKIRVTCHHSRYAPAYALPQFHINTMVAFILFFYPLELEIERSVLAKLAWSCQFLRECKEFVWSSAIVE